MVNRLQEIPRYEQNNKRSPSISFSPENLFRLANASLKIVGTDELLHFSEIQRRIVY
jgi:hypothetical protein